VRGFGQSQRHRRASAFQLPKSRPRGARAGGIAHHALGHSSQDGPSAQQICAFFLHHEFIEVARHAVGKLACECPLYFSPAECSRNRPTCPSSIEAAIGAVDSFRTGCRTNSEFRRSCATILASALFPFPAIHLRHEEPPRVKEPPLGLSARSRPAFTGMDVSACLVQEWIRQGLSVPTLHRASALRIGSPAAPWFPPAAT
jgi:hypothetical protein